MYTYLNNLLSTMINDYKNGDYYDLVNFNPPRTNFEDKIPVWLCWWQGVESAPEIVKHCFNSIEKNFPEEHYKIIYITLQNFCEYVLFPSDIVDNFNAGNITLTHLSDILRSALLYYHGGLWTDATYYLTSPFDNSFHTREMATLSTGKYEWPGISKDRWTGNFMMCKRGTLLPRFMLNSLYMYWATHDKLLEYYILDYIIALAYDSFSNVKKLIDLNTIIEPELSTLQTKLNDDYDEKTWREMNSTTNIYKLTYKKDLSPDSITYYNKIVATNIHLD